jgi:DNA-directed RNA polymerase specialized sigma24 family protein
MTDLEILNENDLSKKVYMVFEKYKPLIMKKAYLYERCSKGRIQKEDFMSDVYEKLYYFVGKIEINKVKNLNKFSYYKSVYFAILRVYYKTRKIFDCEHLFDFDEDGNETVQLVSKFGFSEMAPDISKFMDRLTDRQKYVVQKRMEGRTFLEIRKELNLSHGSVVRDVYIAKQIYNEYF